MPERGIMVIKAAIYLAVLFRRKEPRPRRKASLDAIEDTAAAQWDSATLRFTCRVLQTLRRYLHQQQDAQPVPRSGERGYEKMASCS